MNKLIYSFLAFFFIISTNANPILIRGPYLQMGTNQSIEIRWRTDIVSDSKVTLGIIFGNYSIIKTESSLTIEHIVKVENLFPNTKYFYTIGGSNYILQADQTNNFVTLPLDNSIQKTRFLALGDCGNNSANQFNVKNSTKNFIGNNNIDAMILLGDNAYYSGTDAEYQTNFFNVYKDDFLKYYKLYPALGNHDYGNSIANAGLRNLPYFNSFTTPKLAEIGGTPSNAANYYSFNVGNVHFIALDSFGKDDGNTTKLSDVNGAQVTWLKADLGANNKMWTVVYFHHPPYTKTSHNSDTESDLIAIRENFIRILEQNGVDLVLSGHSHGYERSFLLKEYYNNISAPLFKNDFNPLIHSATADNQNGYFDGSNNSCPYSYNSGKYNHGTIYVVSGSAGQVGGAAPDYPHSCMSNSNNTNGGSFYFEVEDNRLDAKFISYDPLNPTIPVVKDNFTIFKDINRTNNLEIEQNESLTLKASWNGNYIWNNNLTSKNFEVPTSEIGNFNYKVKDNFNCNADEFNIKVVENSSKNIIYPNPTSGILLLKGDFNIGSCYKIFSLEGKLVQDKCLSKTNELDVTELSTGVYVLDIQSKTVNLIKKIIKN